MPFWVKDLKLISEESISFFRDRLLNWFIINGRKFPWRNKSISNYKKLVVEVLLQRTKAETVAKFYNDFFQMFPNWKSIANSNQVKLENNLKPIGLYKQRASRLLLLGQEMSRRNGRIPQEYDELSKLPLIGQYIANSVMSVIFDKPYPMLDVNMARVLERYFGPRKLADIRYDPYLQNLAYAVVNSRSSREINWAILDFAAKVCIARNPDCKNCWLNKKCFFRSSNLSN